MTKRFDVLVVGAGPAGASAALWLKMLGFNPLVVETKDRAGGLQTINPYTNKWIVTSAFATGASIAENINRCLLEEHSIDVWLKSTVTQLSGKDNAFEAVVRTPEGIRHMTVKKIVMASGVRAKAGGFKAASQLIVGPGHQVATAEFKSKRVAILGGGDNAAENYSFIKSKNAACTHVYARTIRARAELLESLNPEDVFVGDYQVDADRNKVNGKPYDIILVLYGWEPHLEYASALNLARTPKGLVVTDYLTGETTVPGVFAAGEIAGRMHPCCVTAMADGVVVAKAIQAQLEASRVAKLTGMFNRLSTITKLV